MNQNTAALLFLLGIFAMGAGVGYSVGRARAWKAASPCSRRLRWPRRLDRAWYLRGGALGVVLSMLFPPFIEISGLYRSRFLGYYPVWRARLYEMSRASIDYPVLAVQCIAIAMVAVLLWIAAKPPALK